MKVEYYLRFKVLTVVRMKIRVFWDIASCSLIIDRHFRGAYCLHHQGIHRTGPGLVMLQLWTHEVVLLTLQSSGLACYSEVCYF
jgi:hypothetical protein